MSLSRLCRRAFPLSPFINTVDQAHFDSRYGFVGTNNFGHTQGLFQIRGFTSRCGNSRSLWETFNSFSQPGIGNVKMPSYLLASQRQFSTEAIREKRSRKMLYYLTGLVFAMVGASYAAVPLYRRFCQATGYGGTVQRRETVEEKIAWHAQDGTVTNREIVVKFNADVADGMPWKFTPKQNEVRVKPGESALAFYTAENRSAIPITGVSTYNVIPMQGSFYSRAKGGSVLKMKLVYNHLAPIVLFLLQWMDCSCTCFLQGI